LRIAPGIPCFYPVLDTAMLARVPIDPVEAARAILEAGARILQFRHKGHFSRAMFDAAERIAELCNTAGALFVVNDRVDIAMMLRAGVHLGQDDLSPTSARRLMGDSTVIGFSTHNGAQIRAAASEPVDYVALGPLFGTTTKEQPDPTVGLDDLRRLRPLAPKPLVAIGGVTRTNALSAFDAGADSVAVIGDLLAGCARVADIGKRTEEWLRLTGSLARVS
jgi:thiamine-phosphate pyrophosphorylase